MEQFERKFVVSEQNARWLDTVLRARGELRVFDQHRPVAYSRTTYLDTHDGWLLRGSGGVTMRLRVREYAAAVRPGGAATWSEPCYLELKRRLGNTRRKDRWGMSRESAYAILDALRQGRDALAALADRSNVPSWASVLGKATLQPRVATWYRRTTFRVASARVTIDCDLLLCSPAPDGSRAAVDVSLIDAPHCIVEIKSDRLEIPTVVIAALRVARAATMHVSKYELAVAAARRRGMLEPSYGAGG